MTPPRGPKIPVGRDGGFAHASLLRRHRLPRLQYPFKTVADIVMSLLCSRPCSATVGSSCRTGVVRPSVWQPNRRRSRRASVPAPRRVRPRWPTGRAGAGWGSRRFKEAAFDGGVCVGCVGCVWVGWVGVGWVRGGWSVSGGVGTVGRVLALLGSDVEFSDDVLMNFRPRQMLCRRCRRPGEVFDGSAVRCGCLFRRSQVRVRAKYGQHRTEASVTTAMGR